MPYVRKAAIGVAVVLALLIAVPLAMGTALPVGHTAMQQSVFTQSPAQLWIYVMAEYRRENTGTYRIASERPPFLLVTQVAHPTVFGGTWTYTLTPTSKGTRLTVIERGEVYNPLFRFLSHYVFGEQTTLNDYFASLKRATHST